MHATIYRHLALLGYIAITSSSSHFWLSEGDDSVPAQEPQLFDYESYTLTNGTI